MYKRTWFAAVLLFISVMFTSCFEITEEFTLNDDGSGEYAMKMDMYKMVEMIASMAGKDKLEGDKEFNKIQDTTILFKQSIDTIEEFSQEEKNLFRNGSMNMRVHLKEKEMLFRFKFPYTKEGDLQKIYNLTPKAMKGIDFKGLNKKEKEENNEEAEEESSGNGGSVTPSPQMAESNQYFDLITGKGFFEKRIKMEEWKNYIEADSSLKQMMPMLGGVYVTSILHLPRPARNVSHPFAQLSADRKTVTLKFPFSDYMERPEVLNFRVEY